LTSPAIEFRDVRKSYLSGRFALDGLTLSVGPSETVALVGPSGCGKTTALKLVNRLLEADSGEILVFGSNVADEEPVALRRKIGYVIQEGGLFPHWDVSGNVEVVPRLLGWDRERRRQRASEVLAMVNLPVSDYGSRPPRALSGGQRQRVGVARALAADPSVVLMDEPFGALDPIARRALQQEFLAWKGKLAKAVLLVTHDLAEAFLLADRVAVMEGGRIRQMGTRADIVTHPADAFVREFVSGNAP
jgi:osmoprotectant transport system ATP-binding protein